MIGQALPAIWALIGPSTKDLAFLAPGRDLPRLCGRLAKDSHTPTGLSSRIRIQVKVELDAISFGHGMDVPIAADDFNFADPKFVAALTIYDQPLDDEPLVAL